MFTWDRPKNYENDILLATWIVFPRFYKVDVFPPQRPYLEIDLQILNNNIFFKEINNYVIL